MVVEIEKEVCVTRVLLKKPSRKKTGNPAHLVFVVVWLACLFLIRFPLISLVLLEEFSWGDRNLRLALNTWSGRNVKGVSRSIPGTGIGLSHFKGEN